MQRNKITKNPRKYFYTIQTNERAEPLTLLKVCKEIGKVIDKRTINVIQFRIGETIPGEVFGHMVLDKPLGQGGSKLRRKHSILTQQIRSKVAKDIVTDSSRYSMYIEENPNGASSN